MGTRRKRSGSLSPIGAEGWGEGAGQPTNEHHTPYTLTLSLLLLLTTPAAPAAQRTRERERVRVGVRARLTVGNRDQRSMECARKAQRRRRFGFGPPVSQSG